MAHVHPTAEITPTKLEICRDWLAATDWFDGDLATLKSGRRLSYRFDDPSGEVGVEVVLVADGDRQLQVPLTYRAEPLPGADAWFLTEMDHTVLGTRHIYDGAGDPVLVAALVNAIRTGAVQEDFEFEVDGVAQVVPASVRVHGTGSESAAVEVRHHGVDRDGSTTRLRTDAGTLVLPHVLGELERATLDADGRDALVGQWPDGPADVVFAVLEPAG